MWEITKILGTDPILKWDIVKKKCRKYKSGDKYCNLRKEEKLARASDNNLNDLLNQRPEILNVCRHKKSWLLRR